MTALAVKSLETPVEVRGRTRLVKLSGATIGLAVLEPGWRWSLHSKPIVGGESCRITHIGYIISGHPRVRMDDGTEGEIGPGSGVQVPPGHDAWVVGDAPCTFVEFFPPATPCT